MIMIYLIFFLNKKCNWEKGGYNRKIHRVSFPNDTRFSYENINTQQCGGINPKTTEMYKNESAYISLLKSNKFCFDSIVNYEQTLNEKYNLLEHSRFKDIWKVFLESVFVLSFNKCI